MTLSVGQYHHRLTLVFVMDNLRHKNCIMYFLESPCDTKNYKAGLAVAVPLSLIVGSIVTFVILR